MRHRDGHTFREDQTLIVLLVLTLISSAVHFADNAFRLDLYPGPAWLTRNVVLAAWTFVLIAACLAYRAGSRWALVTYGLLGFAGLAHYLMPHALKLPLRCAITIGLEFVASALLIVYVFLRPYWHHSPSQPAMRGLEGAPKR